MTSFSGMKCDKCKTETRAIVPITWKAIIIKDITKGDKYYDLCSDCWSSLSQWLGGWREELESDE